MDAIQLLINDVDNIVAGFVSLAFIQLSPGVQSLWRIMLILFIVIYGYKVFVSGDFEARAMMMRTFKFVITLAIATEWGAFSLIVYDLATNFPSEIAQEIIITKGQDAESIDASLTIFFDDGFAVGSELISKSSWNDLTSMFYGACIYISTILFGGYAAFLIILSKLGTALLLAVAPVFILMIVWDGSRDLFAGWLRTLMNYAFIPLFVYTLLALFGSIAESRLDSLDGAVQTGTAIAPALAAYLLATFAGFLLSLQIMTITSSVMGGLSLSTQGWVERTTRGTLRVPGNGVQGAARVGRSTKAAYEAAKSGAQKIGTMMSRG